ncbi:aminotransferase class V-fold PLP-dependent enzyme [Cytophagaceae bacterium DM2B3-1]|uniref:Aminotransferase class V-fold PLP-dependent enzyme n=1 Tax=Xanthocytophaga flava TaxID=3048013 RepID=A0ABT7CG19_9BACT|nr:aminotransferase class V-fold PLP-dependent enzyme [Xanthocytophaga flavus]MDJ1466627.1 aminotransferase class V-fold PLP-dependent enzyme [Xanthocytophaga flavus]MDJ1492623.1 aminotransferase class V-fold PLP-dependent enzyme [Xanthocytophaga flavus]
MLSRRKLLQRLSSFPLLGGMFGSTIPFVSTQAATAVVKRDLFKELGVRTFINAAGTLTYMTGSLMQEEVLQTIQYAAQEFCLLDELQDKVGERIAKLVHSEAAVVTSGAFSALTLGLAGVLTGTDQKKVEQLPHLEYTGMKSEVIVQKGHDIVYLHSLMNTGCKIVFVETVEDVEKAINERTALMWFLHIQSDKGKIKHEEWVTLGKKHNIPTAIDIAADVPPVENLWKFNDMGFSFVAVSGGKAMRGPQSAGILMGKKEIIAAARMHMPPRGFNIGRGMKVNKEEILGMYVALENFIKQDFSKLWKTWEDGIAHIQNTIKPIAGITTEVTVNPLGNHTPTLKIEWDTNKIKMAGKDLQEKLRFGNPSIEIGGSGPSHINLTVWMMKPGQEKIVATRIKEELTKASA